MIIAQPLPDLAWGDTLSIAFTAFEQDGITPLDISTASEIEFVIKTDEVEATADAVACSLGSGITITDGAAGTFDVSKGAASMKAATTAGTTYCYSCVVVIAGVRMTLCKGTIKIVGTTNPS